MYLKQSTHVFPFLSKLLSLSSHLFLVPVKVLLQGRFQPPSCLTRISSPARRSTAASFALKRVRGRSSVAWWLSTTLCTREKRASTSLCHCLSGGVWESTTPPPKSTSWKTRMMVRHADAPPIVLFISDVIADDRL